MCNLLKQLKEARFEELQDDERRLSVLLRLVQAKGLQANGLGIKLVRMWSMLMCDEPIGDEIHVDSNVLNVLSASQLPSLREDAAKPRRANGGGAAAAQRGPVKQWMAASFPDTAEGRIDKRDFVNAIQIINKIWCSKDEASRRCDACPLAHQMCLYAAAHPHAEFDGLKKRNIVPVEPLGSRYGLLGGLAERVVIGSPYDTLAGSAPGKGTWTPRVSFVAQFDEALGDLEDLAGPAPGPPYRPMMAVPCLDASTASKHLSTAELRGVARGHTVFVTHAVDGASRLVRKLTVRERGVVGIKS